MSKEQPTDNQLITVPIKDLLYLILGDSNSGSPCNPIPLSIARILEPILKDSSIYKLSYETYSHIQGVVPTKQPILWWYDDWKTASSTYKVQKEYIRKEQEERWILTANVEMVAKAIIRKAPVGEDVARLMAYNMMKSENPILVLKNFFGINKLKERIEEI